MADQNINEAERAIARLRATKPWPQSVTVDLAWSSRAFNIGLAVGLPVSASLAVVVAGLVVRWGAVIGALCAASH